jgi:two-component system, LytTR family, sensor kinase
MYLVLCTLYKLHYIYPVRTKKIRFLYMILVGIGVSLLLDIIKKGNVVHASGFIHYFISVTITILVWEGNLWLDYLMDLKLPWEKYPGRRIMIHLPAGIIFSVGAIYFSMLVFDILLCPEGAQPHGGFMPLALTIGTLVSILVLSLEVSTQFFRKWKRSLVEVEKYKAQSLQAQLQNLKDQINPHFMFNNLSVLSSLVYKDQDKAVDFINQLSKVYRYLLDSHNCEMVRLEEELNFVQSYTYLLQIRFDKNLVVHFDISEDSKRLLLPPMALQILIENAIKHNEVSEQLPLNIHIRTENTSLEVSNNRQLRSSSENGSKNGLKNIRERYKFFTTREMEILETASAFTVKIPLLAAK